MRRELRLSELQITANQISPLYKGKKLLVRAAQTASPQLISRFSRSDQRSMHRKSRQYSSQKRREALSSSGLSIGQIKSKIKQLLHTNREVCSANSHTDSLRDARSTRDYFRAAIFRNYNKKKVQLKMLGQINTDSSNLIGQQFHVSQACINRRFSFREHNEGSIFSRNQRFRHLCQQRQQDISVISKSDKINKHNKDKSRISNALLSFQRTQINLQPWKQNQFEQFQDFALRQN